jgi:hypothetical protein
VPVLSLGALLAATGHLFDLAWILHYTNPTSGSRKRKTS